VTLHIDNLKGFNAHHQCETIFKAFARAMRLALEHDERMAGVIPRPRVLCNQERLAPALHFKAFVFKNQSP
jgi:hypothetical protein